MLLAIAKRTSIGNHTNTKQIIAVKGTAVFTLFDPMTEKVIATQRQKFLVEAGRNTAVNFHFEGLEGSGVVV